MLRRSSQVWGARPLFRSPKPPRVTLPSRASRLHPPVMPSQAAARTQMVKGHFSSASAASGSQDEASDGPPEPLVTFESDGHFRAARLNRPKALNSLNREMVDLLAPKLRRWEDSTDVRLIILEGEGRAFCAGGDVVSLAGHVASTDAEERLKAVDFFRAEYELDSFIAKMTTPVVCLLDGIAMGGGLGVSMHTPFRVATENTRIAMPETTIGLFPDVGAAFFLSRLDGEIGTYLGLTSESIFGWGAVQSGFATHYVAASSIPAVRERLRQLSADCSLESINEALSEFAPDARQATADKPYPLVGARRLAIDHCFAKETVEDILAELAAVESGKLFPGADLDEWAKKTRETIEQRSPTSCKVTLIALRESKRLNIDDVFLMDLRLAATCCDTEIHPDFHTGVSHLLIKKAKDRADWQPADLAGVDVSNVKAKFFSDKPAPSTRVLPLRFIPAQMDPYHEYPHHFGLPREGDVAALVTGEAKGSGSFAPTRAEVLKLAQRRWHGRVGVKERVEEILDRKTEQDKGEGESTLRWRG